jgi:hypothetical protein
VPNTDFSPAADRNSTARQSVPSLTRRRALQTAVPAAFRGTVAATVRAFFLAGSALLAAPLRGILDWLGLLARAHLGPEDYCPTELIRQPRAGSPAIRC